MNLASCAVIIIMGYNNNLIMINLLLEEENWLDKINLTENYLVKI